MISHAHRCIFIHIPKTGGTSLEDMIWPRSLRTPDDLWMGFIDRFHNPYQTGGLQHLLARQVRTAVGAEVFASYFKFAIVRNPWDRAVSQYVSMRNRPDLREFVGMEPGDSFERYLELIRSKMHVQWESQIEFLRDDDGTTLVDHVGRFERFGDEAKAILDRIGMPAAAVPHENKGNRGRYQDYYDDTTREIVAQLYSTDIETFGYI